MSHLQLELSRVAYKVTLFFESILDTFHNVSKAFMKSRQCKANMLVAQQLQHEYPHETFAYILRLIEEGRVNDLNTQNLEYL